MTLSKTKICSVEGCGKFVEARGLCPRHYKQFRKHGHVLPIYRSIKAPNEFVPCGDYTEVVLYNKFGLEIARSKVDNASVDIIKDLKWSFGSGGYASSHINRKRILMHRLLTGFDGQVDHANGDRLDNRIANLREATPLQNARNTRMQSNNTTGYKGLIRFRDRYRVVITVGGKGIHLGCFKDPVLAAMEYDIWAVKYFGEFARTNFPIPQEKTNNV